MQIHTYEEAIKLLNRFPSFTYAAICARRLAPDAEEAGRLGRIIGLQTGEAFGRHPKSTPKEDESEAKAVSPAAPIGSADAIDIFLAHYSNPATEPPLQYIPGLDRPGTCVIPADTQLSAEDEARNLIKNHKYAEALAIIEELNLNNPEKSIYFADQIRFLKKLIINQAKN